MKKKKRSDLLVEDSDVDGLKCPHSSRYWYGNGLEPIVQQRLDSGPSLSIGLSALL